MQVRRPWAICLERTQRPLPREQHAPLRWALLTIVVLAGAWTLFHLIWNVAKQTSDDYWGVALPILFVLALILAFIQFAQEWPALQAAPSPERFPEPAITKFFLASEGSAGLWFVVRMYVGAEWLLAGWEKVTSPAWGTAGTALSGFWETIDDVSPLGGEISP